MANYSTCRQCNSKLFDDDRAIYRKLVLRNAEEFLCIKCLADYFDTTEEKINKLIEHYRESGECTLFR